VVQAKRFVLGGVVLALAVPAGAQSRAASGTVTVKVTITGEAKGAISGTKAEDPKDMLPATNACTRFTKPNFPRPGRPLAYNVSFGNPDVIKFRKGIFFAFYYDPKQVGSPQKLYNGPKGGGVQLLAVVKRNDGFAAAQQGWAGTVTLNSDLRSGSFVITGAHAIIGNEKVTVRGTWRCSVTFVRAT
jgi:hypothetical protein